MGTPFERAEELKRKSEEELDGACWGKSLQLLTLLQVIPQLVGLWLRLARITASRTAALATQGPLFSTKDGTHTNEGSCS
ncbi:hypothetical protein SLA2020_067840 [Shorea laevis]